jgi:hypothetical protein
MADLPLRQVLVADHVPEIDRGKIGLISFYTPAGYYRIITMPNRDFVLPELAAEPEDFMPQSPPVTRPQGNVDDEVKPPELECNARKTKKEQD